MNNVQQFGNESLFHENRTKKIFKCTIQFADEKDIMANAKDGIEYIRRELKYLIPGY